MDIGEIRVSDGLTEDGRAFISVCDVCEIATVDIKKDAAIELINKLSHVFDIELVGLDNV